MLGSELQISELQMYGRFCEGQYLMSYKSVHHGFYEKNLSFGFNEGIVKPGILSAQSVLVYFWLLLLSRNE